MRAFVLVTRLLKLLAGKRKRKVLKRRDVIRSLVRLLELRKLVFKVLEV